MSRYCTLATPALLVASCLFARSGWAQFDSVAYEVQSGSILQDSCHCGRPDIEYRVVGSFTLTRLPVRIRGEAYSVSDVKLTCVADSGECLLEVSGEGSYYRPDLATQSAELKLAINGAESVTLRAESIPTIAPWPVIDFSVSQDAIQAVETVFTLRVLASPKVNRVSYELVRGNLNDDTGSFLEVVCLTCRLAHPRVPLEGTFDVGLASLVADGFNVYSVGSLDFQDVLADPNVSYRLQGSGTYEEGGDAAILKQMRLLLEINGVPLQEFKGGPFAVKPGAAFPVIDMELEQVVQQTLWYRLHIVANPAAAQSFRRSDSNSDAKIDITDAVYTLTSLFLGGPAPGCLDAADADASGQLDITDAVYTLGYLFLGGPEPPRPGPRDCGEAPEAKLGCRSYPACAAAL